MSCLMHRFPKEKIEGTYQRAQMGESTPNKSLVISGADVPLLYVTLRACAVLSWKLETLLLRSSMTPSFQGGHAG